jgi:light-regulated signal transduction histidine kinase (bacteriophytochrome)
MKTTDFGKLLTGVAAATVVAFGVAYAQQGPRGKSSYMQVEINPENLERIFDAFFTTKADGLGMGLSICRAIIQAHGGRLSVTRGAAEGAILQFTLPAGTDSAS